MQLSNADKAKLCDREWRLNNLYWITNKDKKKIKFRMNIAQQMIHASSSKMKATLKARQLGVSTYHILEKADKAFFGRNKTVVIVAHERDAIKKLFRIVRYAYDKMHPSIRPAIHKGGGSQYEMYFPEINSRIYCDLESRGDTISDLHISEYAFCDTERVNATIDAVPVETGSISIESTPKGLNHFHEKWNDGKWPYKKFFFPWFINREYQLTSMEIEQYTKDELNLIKYAKENYNILLTQEEIAFRRFKISQKNKSHFLQEFPEDEMSCFLMSGQPVMDKFNLQTLINELRAPLDNLKGVLIFKKPTEGVEYVIGADVAEGVGSDYSVASIYQRDTLEQVALYRGHIKPFDFADKLMEIRKMFLFDNNTEAPTPILAVERNNHGHAVIGKLVEYRDNDKRINIYRASDKRDGWLTSKVTRPLMIDTFIESVETSAAKINDVTTLKECQTLIDNNGKIEAEKGCHDDCVIASSIAIQVCIKKPIARQIRLTGL